MNPESIIASWINEDATRGFNLQADGTLVEVTREGRGYVWSPPSAVGKIQGCTEAVEALLTISTPGSLDASDPKWEGAEFPAISEVEYEQLLDKRIQARLATDGAYLNAANAQQQAERERVIEDEEAQHLDAQIGRARARRGADPEYVGGDPRVGGDGGGDPFLGGEVSF